MKNKLQLKIILFVFLISGVLFNKNNVFAQEKDNQKIFVLEKTNFQNIPRDDLLFLDKIILIHLFIVHMILKKHLIKKVMK